MALPLFIAPLLAQGLNLLANAALAKGKEWVEERTGVKLGKELTPEDAGKLKQFELENEVELARIQHEDNKLDAMLEGKRLEDVKDARARDIAIQAGGRKNERADNLAYMAVGGFLVVALVLALAAIGGVSLEQGTKEVLIYILGVLQTIVVGIFNFEFGTSKGEQRKDNAMTKWLDEGE